MSKIKFLLVSLAVLITGITKAQTITISNPSLTSPYQVTPGTIVTIEWDAMGAAPNSFYSSTSIPTVQNNLPPDVSWTAHTNFTGPTNTKYYQTITVNSDTWIWAGIGGFIGWQYSNVISIQTISSYSITASDTAICPTNGSVVFTAPSGTGYTYQWHDLNGVINGETGSIFTATSAGSYHCVITIGGTPNTTNTISISDYVATFDGTLANNQVTMTADQSYTSYQWYERIGTGTATPISGATSSTYTATISTSATYYSFEGVVGLCTINSTEKLLIDTLFNAPTITLNATPNSQGFVCEGSEASITAIGNTSNLIWYKNGSSQASATDSLTIWGAWQNGTWTASATPNDWPNISVVSNAVQVSILDLIEPDVSGANYYDYFCNGDVVNFILTDEGYTYTWYVHDSNNVFGPTDIISIPTGVYQHNFTSSKYVTIVAEFNGCSTSTTKFLKDYSEKIINTTIDNYNQQYLCTDSSVTISVSSWEVSDYTNFQWHKLIGTNWVAMAGETTADLVVITPGNYKVEANPIACSGVTASSNPQIIHSYLNRKPSIYALKNTMCEGDTTVLQLSGGGSWSAKQWLESNINIGTGGYERSYIGMLTNSGQDTQEVTKYSSYQLSAKHVSCPNGLKTKSNIVFITPTANPEIIQMNNHPSEPMHIIDWDSTHHIIGCQDETVQLTLNNTAFDSIIWHVQGYMGDDDYAWGNQVHIGDTLNETMDAKWVTAVVEDANGCRGQSTPLLLDSRVFSTPAVASYNNSELCEQGDSTLVHLAFAGTWISYEWSKDGTPIPNSNNDSLWAKEPGTYTISAIPTDCPNFSYSSGLGPYVKYLYSEILENDTLIYAMPELGYYMYQWYLNGDSIEAAPNRPWVIYKADMQPGVYTVEVSNENCTKISEGFLWEPSSIENPIFGVLDIYPNPTNDFVYIENVKLDEVVFVLITDLNGRQIMRENGLTTNQLDVSALNTGMYILTLALIDGHQKVVKLSVN